MDDEQIINMYFARDEQALTRTSEKYSGLCGRVAFGILKSREDSEECVNDTWLKAWESIPPARPVSLPAFLMKITRNLSISLWRKKQRKCGADVCIDELAECLPDRRGEASDDMAVTDALNRFLEGLKPEARRIFVQKYWYVRTAKEIARELSMSESAVKMRLTRTRAELREFLEKEGISV